MRRGASSVREHHLVLVKVTLTAGQCHVVDIPGDACAASLNVNTFDPNLRSHGPVSASDTANRCRIRSAVVLHERLPSSTGGGRDGAPGSPRGWATPGRLDATRLPACRSSVVTSHRKDRHVSPQARG
jgi:hypothetical protein